MDEKNTTSRTECQQSDLHRDRRRLGILGLGEGRSIVSAALTSSRWEPARLCDLNESLLAARIEEFGLKPDIGTIRYEDLLEDPSIDAIGIYTPDPLHARHIRMALEAGKHVICTKPAVVSPEEAEPLIALQEKTGLQVFIGQSSRFFGPMLRQRRDWEQGRLGRLTCVEAFYKADARWFLEKSWSRGAGFSWMTNFMIHAVDLACWYLPDIREVFGMGLVSGNTRKFGLDCPDVLKFLFRDSEGRIAQVEGHYASAALGHAVEPSISCTLRGEAGVSRAEYPNLKYFTAFDDEEPAAYDLEDERAHYFRFEGTSHHAGEYQNYIDAFADALDRGETAKPDLREAAGILEVMAAMTRSLASGRTESPRRR